MTRVNSSDHVLLLLRERLQRLGKERAGRSAPAATGRKAAPSSRGRLQALAAFDGMGGEEMRRGLVRALLTEEIGEAAANDPAFQAVADDVFRMISGSPEGRDLIERAALQLRSSG